MYNRSDCFQYGLLQRKSTILDVGEFIISMALPYSIIFIINISLLCKISGSIFRTNESNETVRIEFYNSPETIKQYRNRKTQDECSDNYATQEPLYRHGSHDKEKQYQQKLSLSLTCILFMLLICYLPSFILEESLIELIFRNSADSDFNFRFRLLGTKLSHILIYINCSANVIIYCISNEKYFNSIKNCFIQTKPAEQINLDSGTFKINRPTKFSLSKV